MAEVRRRTNAAGNTGIIKVESSVGRTGHLRMASVVRRIVIVSAEKALRNITGKWERTTPGLRRESSAGNGRIIGSVTTAEETADRSRKGRPVKMLINLKENERIDDLQRNGYQIIQNPGKFCFGMDAVLLTGFAHARQEDRLLDMGTGTGIIPLLMEAKYHCAHLTGLEIQPESADMAERSVALNGLTDKITIVTGDIKEADKIFQSASFDCVTCNPPYMIGNHGIANPDAPKAIARHELLCGKSGGKAGKAGRKFFPGSQTVPIGRDYEYHGEI